MHTNVSENTHQCTTTHTCAALPVLATMMRLAYTGTSRAPEARCHSQCGGRIARAAHREGTLAAREAKCGEVQ